MNKVCPEQNQSHRSVQIRHFNPSKRRINPVQLSTNPIDGDGFGSDDVSAYDGYPWPAQTRGFEDFRLYSVGPIDLVGHYVDRYRRDSLNVCHIDDKVDEVTVASVQGDLVKIVADWEEKIGIDVCVCVCVCVWGGGGGGLT